MFCTRCGKKISTVVWLELNCLTGVYTNPKTSKIPEEESQGVFPFGQTCAKKEQGEI